VQKPYPTYDQNGQYQYPVYDQNSWKTIAAAAAAVVAVAVVFIKKSVTTYVWLYNQ